MLQRHRLQGNSRLIASTPSRNNSEDMDHGNNGNTTGIEPTKLLTQSDNDLFRLMTNLFDDCTVFDNDLRAVGHDMIQTFRNNAGGQYSNPVLNQKVQVSSELYIFLQEFGKKLNENLQQSGLDINAVSQIIIPQQ